MSTTSIAEIAKAEQAVDTEKILQVTAVCLRQLQGCRRQRKLYSGVVLAKHGGKRPVICAPCRARSARTRRAAWVRLWLLRLRPPLSPASRENPSNFICRACTTGDPGSRGRLLSLAGRPWRSGAPLAGVGQQRCGWAGDRLRFAPNRDFLYISPTGLQLAAFCPERQERFDPVPLPYLAAICMSYCKLSVARLDMHGAENQQLNKFCCTQ